MSILSIDNLSFSFGDKTVLKNVSFRMLRKEHIGLIGANGAGKTTLFNILTGRLVPDEGSIISSANINIGYLDQHSELIDGKSIRETLKEAFSKLYDIEKQMVAIGDSLGNAEKDDYEKLLKEFGRLQDKLSSSEFYSIDSLISNVAGGLGLLALGMDTPVDKLSGGQRTKVKLAKLLLGNPDVLLLDEPTNYLDKEHIEWLANYLSDYPNSFMVISHDTAFLNRITNVIYNLEYTLLKRYPGNYEKFLKLRDEEKKRYAEQYNRQQQQIEKLEDFINKNIARASTTKQAQSRRKQLEKIDRLEKPKSLPKPCFSFQCSRESGRNVFKCSSLNIGYTYPIVQNLKLNLEKGDKIAITGCNGIGKTTLLKTIMGVIAPLAGEIFFGDFLFPVYYEQESKPTDYTALEEVWREFPKMTQKEVREALAKSGLKQEHILRRMSSLSGGEQSKVRLCKLMMRESNWLLLDEPTNHLDISAKQALKEALQSYNGTILLVCHEKEFYENWITDIWDMEEYSYGRQRLKLSAN
ncbi:MAG: ABC-F family ATP-binding cassette domain-containing protein [Bacillota bacterium]